MARRAAAGRSAGPPHTIDWLEANATCGRGIGVSADPLSGAPPQRLFRFLVGFPLRLVLAILRSSFLLIDLYIPLEAPFRDDFERFPRFAASAAPAAICCFFDFAGIQNNFARRLRNGLLQLAMRAHCSFASRRHALGFARSAQSKNANRVPASSNLNGFARQRHWFRQRLLDRLGN
jgi:hypothetical protein